MKIVTVSFMNNNAGLVAYDLIRSYFKHEAGIALKMWCLSEIDDGVVDLHPLTS